LIYWYKSTNTDAGRCLSLTLSLAIYIYIYAYIQQSALYSFYLIYWYKSTNTDAEGGAWQNIEFNFKFLVDASMAAGTQFTCFTSTTVQILTQTLTQISGRCEHGSRYLVYLLY
jgi:hypothetical protein